MLTVPTDASAELARLKAEPKFCPDELGFYPGMPNESQRKEAEAILNSLIETIGDGIARSPSKAFILREFADTLKAFELFDTEDRERICQYLQEIMGIVGLESSDGLLNTWLYGFDPS